MVCAVPVGVLPDRPGVSLGAIEEPAAQVLRAVIANGVFEPLRGVS
jgi:hypothetical protein